MRLCHSQAAPTHTHSPSSQAREPPRQVLPCNVFGVLFTFGGSGKKTKVKKRYSLEAVSRRL